MFSTRPQTSSKRHQETRCSPTVDALVSYWPTAVRDQQQAGCTEETEENIRRWCLCGSTCQESCVQRALVRRGSRRAHDVQPSAARCQTRSCCRERAGGRRVYLWASLRPVAISCSAAATPLVESGSVPRVVLERLTPPAPRFRSSSDPRWSDGAIRLI